MKDDIRKIIERAILVAQKSGIFLSFDLIKDGKPIVEIDRPLEKIHGDYSSNIALRLSKILNQDACEIATKIGDLILEEREKTGIINGVEIVHPGFLNIFLFDKYIQNKILEILKQKDGYGNIQGSRVRGRMSKVLLEFLSANPTGQLHLGHGRNAFWGDVLAKVLTKAGYIVKKEYYINNAKASTQIKTLGQTSVGEGEAYLNDYLEEKLKVKSSKLKVLIKNTKDKEKLYCEAGFLMAGELLRDLKKFIEKDLKIKFDIWFSEEDELYKKKLVEKMHKWLKDNNFVYKKEGAEWLKIGGYGDSEDRVLVRSDEAHTPTYLLPDIAYHANKIKRGFGRLINIWGADHQGHVKSMKASLKMLKFNGVLDILITQMVSLKEGDKKIKLSKRKGKVVTMESLIDEVGLDSVRFFYLLKSLDTHMELDLELMKEQSSKNPVFYVQYAHARIQSILKKARIKNQESRIRNPHLEMLSTESELELIKELLRFPELIEEISRDYQVHRLTHYTIGLADKFHHFYHECRVIGDDELLTGARLALIEATKITLKNTLNILGVSAPEKM